jgi:hypothetical protein
MALMNFKATQVAASSPPGGSVNATATQRHRMWCRATIEVVGTFFGLAGVAVGILTLRSARVLIHGAMY